MGKQITQKQNSLKKNDTGTPHQITAAVVGKKEFCDDEFDLKKQKRGQKRDDG